MRIQHLSFSQLFVYYNSDVRFQNNHHYRHFLLVFEGLFLYRSVHQFKCPVILNVTLRLIFDGNNFNLSVNMHIRDP